MESTTFAFPRRAGGREDRPAFVFLPKKKTGKRKFCATHLKNLEGKGGIFFLFLSVLSVGNLLPAARQYKVGLGRKGELLGTQASRSKSHTWVLTLLYSDGAGCM